MLEAHPAVFFINMLDQLQHLLRIVDHNKVLNCIVRYMTLGFLAYNSKA